MGFGVVCVRVHGLVREGTGTVVVCEGLEIAREETN